MAVDKNKLEEEATILRFYKIVLSWDYLRLLKQSGVTISIPSPSLSLSTCIPVFLCFCIHRVSCLKFDETICAMYFEEEK